MAYYPTMSTQQDTVDTQVAPRTPDPRQMAIATPSAPAPAPVPQPATVPPPAPAPTTTQTAQPVAQPAPQPAPTQAPVQAAPAPAPAPPPPDPRYIAPTAPVAPPPPQPTTQYSSTDIRDALSSYANNAAQARAAQSGQAFDGTIPHDLQLSMFNADGSSMTPDQLIQRYPEVLPWLQRRESFNQFAPEFLYQTAQNYSTSNNNVDPNSDPNYKAHLNSEIDRVMSGQFNLSNFGGGSEAGTPDMAGRAPAFTGGEQVQFTPQGYGDPNQDRRMVAGMTTPSADNPMGTGMVFNDPQAAGGRPPAGPTDMLSRIGQMVEGAGGAGGLPQIATGNLPSGRTSGMAGQVGAPQAGGMPASGGINPNGPVTNPNALERFITPENTLRNQRIGFDVNAGSLKNELQSFIESQLPQLDQRLAKQLEGHAKRTSALGRAGSGMFEKGFGEISDAARADRDALFGGKFFSAANRDLDANMGVDMSRLSHLIGERGYENNLANQATADEANRLRFLSPSLNTNSYDGLIDALFAGSGNYGQNAATLNSQLGDAAQAGYDPMKSLIDDLLKRYRSGGGQPAGDPMPAPSGGGGYA